MRCPQIGGPFVIGVVNHAREKATMKYALLIYTAPDVRDLPEDQLKAVIREYDAISDAPGVLDGMQLLRVEPSQLRRERGNPERAPA